MSLPEEGPSTEVQRDDVAWERVHTVNDFFDRPILGLAEYRGKYVIYAAVFDEELDDYTGVYRIISAGAEMVVSLLEADAEWYAWHEKWKTGKLPLTSAPDNCFDLWGYVRHAALYSPASDRLANAEFRSGAPDQYEVKWNELARGSI